LGGGEGETRGRGEKGTRRGEKWEMDFKMIKVIKITKVIEGWAG
jgi:hypothetical protein